MPPFFVGLILVGSGAGPVNKMPMFFGGVSFLGPDLAGNKTQLFLRGVRLLMAGAGPLTKCRCFVLALVRWGPWPAPLTKCRCFLLALATCRCLLRALGWLGAGAGPVNRMPLFLVGVTLFGAGAGPVNKMP